MAVDEMSMTSKIVLAMVGTLFTITAGMATYTGQQTNEELHQLRVELSALVTRLSILERVVESLPPSEWRTRISLQDARLERLERHLMDLQEDVDGK